MVYGGRVDTCAHMTTHTHTLAHRAGESTARIRVHERCNGLGRCVISLTLVGHCSGETHTPGCTPEIRRSCMVQVRNIGACLCVCGVGTHPCHCSLCHYVSSLCALCTRVVHDTHTRSCMHVFVCVTLWFTPSCVHARVQRRHDSHSAVWRQEWCGDVLQLDFTVSHCDGQGIHEHVWLPRDGETHVQGGLHPSYKCCCQDQGTEACVVWCGCCSATQAAFIQFV